MILDIADLSSILLFPVVRGVFRIVEIPNLILSWPPIFDGSVTSNPGQTQIIACLIQGGIWILVFLTVELALHPCYGGSFWGVGQVGVSGVPCLSRTILPYYVS